MACSLPPEIFDIIVEYLCNEPTTLRACCLTSKSWVPRTRKHLFACVCFDLAISTIQSWMKAFPDPSNSPAHHARYLRVPEPVAVNSPWIRSFHHVEELSVSAVYWEDISKGSLVQFHGLSPALKSLHLTHFFIPLSEIFDLVCSFPLLEDLTLRHRGAESDSDEWVTPSTSPKFTGTLHLTDQVHSATRGLLGLPDGLHFTNVMVECQVEDAGSAINLVLGCSDTLESLCIDYSLSGSFETPPPLDLSHAAKLKEVEFRFLRPSVQWIVMTLQTAKAESLQQITIFSSVVFGGVEEVDRREWQDLDHLLVRLWTSRSIIPKIKYRTQEVTGLGEAAPILLPELVSRGIACEAENHWQP